MRYIAAYLLLQTGGHANPSAKDIKKVIEAGGVVCDEELLDTFLEAVKGKDINQLITAGSSKLASVSESIPTASENRSLIGHGSGTIWWWWRRGIRRCSGRGRRGRRSSSRSEGRGEEGGTQG